MQMETRKSMLLVSNAQKALRGSCKPLTHYHSVGCTPPADNPSAGVKGWAGFSVIMNRQQPHHCMNK